MESVDKVSGFSSDSDSFKQLYGNNPDLALTKAIESMEECRRARREKALRDLKRMKVRKDLRKAKKAPRRHRRGSVRGTGQKMENEMCLLLSRIRIGNRRDGTSVKLDYSDMEWESSANNNISL